MHCRYTLERDKKIVNAYIGQIRKYNHEEKLSQIYNFVKSVSDNYYRHGHIEPEYETLKKRIFFAEDKCLKKRIIEVPANFNISEEPDSFIEYVVYCNRKYLLARAGGDPNNDITNVDLTNGCKIAANHILHLCENYHVPCERFAIFPGYDKRAHDLYAGKGYHFFIVIYYEKKYYLVDITYSQFYSVRNNNLDILGVLEMYRSNVGTFMLMSEEGRKIAIQLLRDGFIELNADVLKTYLDPFTLSFRNGLYYEETNDFSYIAPYSIDDYINFLLGKDNQLNYEEREHLGFQKRPLKDWTLNFRK